MTKIQKTFRLDKQSIEWLLELAATMTTDGNMSETVRLLIRDAHRAKFGGETPKADD